jgi:hypothetical protein
VNGGVGATCMRITTFGSSAGEEDISFVVIGWRKKAVAGAKYVEGKPYPRVVRNRYLGY